MFKWVKNDQAGVLGFFFFFLQHFRDNKYLRIIILFLKNLICDFVSCSAVSYFHLNELHVGHPTFKMDTAVVPRLEARVGYRVDTTQTSERTNELCKLSAVLQWQAGLL